MSLQDTCGFSARSTGDSAFGTTHTPAFTFLASVAFESTLASSVRVCAAAGETPSPSAAVANSGESSGAIEIGMGQDTGYVPFVVTSGVPVGAGVGVGAVVSLVSPPSLYGRCGDCGGGCAVAEGTC